jgi:hypothetical protein
VVPHVVNDHDIDNLDEGSFMFEYQCASNEIESTLAKNELFVAVNIPLQNPLCLLTTAELRHTANARVLRLYTRYSIAESRAV